MSDDNSGDYLAGNSPVQVPESHPNKKRSLKMHTSPTRVGRSAFLPSAANAEPCRQNADLLAGLMECGRAQSAPLRRAFRFSHRLTEPLRIRLDDLGWCISEDLEQALTTQPLVFQDLFEAAIGSTVLTHLNIPREVHDEH